MILREDLPCLMINANFFQKFDHGEKIREVIPKEWNLKEKECVIWYCGRYDGIAKIKKVNGSNLFMQEITLEKIV